ncbi:nuclear distribution protein nudE-like 1-B [Lepeophtheirus salmonis]|nr:nuclear distribution protein nudE-like 1-B [Lepeophtheirus salmonis]
MTIHINNSFVSQHEEIQYWKEKALALEREVNGAKNELDEFQESSRELELELEAEIEILEKKNKDLNSVSLKLRNENDNLKEKYEQCNREYNSQLDNLQTELSEIQSVKERLNKYVRELEQENDDLERAKRTTVASLEYFETRLNAALERNVFLESELDEKGALQATEQRLKDEVKDLRSELRVLVPDNDKAALINSLKCDSASKSNLKDSTLTPAPRVSASIMVKDLLLKAGALETKLVLCRNIVREDHNYS